MKSTPQVRSNGASIAPKNQIKNRVVKPAAKFPAVKSPFGPEFDLVEGQPENACLCIFDRENQQPVSKIPLTEQEYKALREATIAMLPSGKSITGIVAEAVREKLFELDRFPCKAILGDAHELETAIQQTHALNMLLFDSSNSPDHDKYSDEIRCGIVGLISETSCRLDRAFAAVEQKIRKPAAATPAS